MIKATPLLMLVALSCTAYGQTMPAATVYFADDQIIQSVRQSRRALLSEDAAALTDHGSHRSAVTEAVQALAQAQLPVAKTPATSPATQPASAPASRPAVAPSPLPADQGSDALARLRQTPQPQPLMHAEEFFQAGRLEEAAVLYEQALNCNRYQNHEDWLLLQLATCLEKSQPGESIKLYGQLISKHSKSNYVVAAKARLAVMEWIASQEVQSVLKESAK